MIEKGTEVIPINTFLQSSISERFSIVRALSDQIEVGEKLLPEKIFLGIESEKEGKELNEVAVGLWEDLFKEDEFVEILTRINLDPASRTFEVHQKLKMIRIAQVILRDANRLFSESHLNPESFYSFAKVLGSFNDNFETNITEPLADQVLETMTNSGKEDCNRQFIPCSPESFEGYLKTEVDLIANHLSMRELPIETLHDLRRTTRRFLNLFLLRTLKYPDTESFCMYAYLRKVNTVLGECLDERIRINTGTQELEDLIKIPEVVEELVTEFLARVVWSS
jgi:hypothetical protein